MDPLRTPEVVDLGPTDDVNGYIKHPCDCGRCGLAIYLTPDADDRLTSQHLYVQVNGCPYKLVKGTEYAGFIGDEHKLFRFPDLPKPALDFDVELVVDLEML